MKYQIEYWIEAEGFNHEGCYITDEPRGFIKYAKGWYGSKIHFKKIKEVAK